MEQEEQQIRKLISDWTQATAECDLDRILGFMAADVVFLAPGQPPMRGRAAFADAFRAVMAKVRIQAEPDIQEVQIMDDHAFCWNHLSLTVTPLNGRAPSRRKGHVLSVFRKEGDGRWLLLRDANMLTA